MGEVKADGGSGQPPSWLCPWDGLCILVIPLHFIYGLIGFVISLSPVWGEGYKCDGLVQDAGGPMIPAKLASSLGSAVETGAGSDCPKEGCSLDRVSSGQMISKQRWP